MNQYKKLVEKPGSIRYAKDSSIIQDLMLEQLITHSKGINQYSKKIISSVGTLFSEIYEDYPLPLNGIYKFEYNGSVLKCKLNDVEIDSIVVVAGGKYSIGNFVVKMNQILNIGYSLELAVFNAKIYHGIEITGTASNMSISAGVMSIGGNIVHIPQTNINYSADSVYYLLLTVQLEEVDYTDDPEYLGHFMASIDDYHPRSPGAIKIISNISISDSLYVPQFGDNIFVVPLAKCSASPVQTYIERLPDSFIDRYAIYKTLEPVYVDRLKSIASELIVDMNDGNGNLRLLTEKIPSMPNVVDHINYAIYPYQFAPDSEIDETLRLREINVISQTMLQSHVFQLKDLYNKALFAESYEDLEASFQSCLATGAITQDQYEEMTEILNLDDLPGYIGNENSGLIKIKLEAIEVTEQNIKVYNQQLYAMSQVAMNTNIVRGRLYIDWDEPELVDNEAIIKYKIKIIRTSKSFDATSDDLINNGINNPKAFLENLDYAKYIIKSEPIEETDAKRKIIVDKEYQYVDDAQTNSYNCDVTPNEKVVVFLSCITEYGIEGNWSIPFVIDVPNIIIDPIIGTIFADYEDANKKIRTAAKEIEQSMLKQDIDQKLFDIQISMSDFVTKTELSEKIMQK
jgi:hypothetical protein